MLKAVTGGSSGGGGITISTTTITGGTNTRVLFDDNGVIGEDAGLTYTKGTTLLAVTKASIGGATIGTNALAVTGSSLLPSVNTALIYPATDSTTAIKITKADTTTSLLVVDSTNSRVGINGTPTSVFQAFAPSGSTLIGNVSFSPATTSVQSSATNVVADGTNVNNFISVQNVGVGAGSASLLAMPSSGVVRTGSASTSGLIFLTQTNAPFIIATGGFALTNERFRILGSAATFNYGGPDAAAPGAVTFTQQSVLAGTSNTSGVNWTITGSLSTGSGTSGDIVFQTGGTGAGATAQNTAATALTIKGATQTVQIASGKALQLGNAATTGLAAGVLAATTNATLVLTDSTGQAYRIPCII